MDLLLLLLCLLPLGVAEFPDLRRISLDVPKNESGFPPQSIHFVIGGDRARAGRFPWQAYILFSTTSAPSLTAICGGTLLSPRHVLTAAHCVVDMVAPSFVMLGSVDLDTVTANTKWREVHTKLIHPAYSTFDATNQNDIAVLEFSPSVTFNADVKPVKILKDDRVVSWKEGIVTGFGTFKHKRNSYGDPLQVTSRYLLFANVQIFDQERCKRIYRNPFGGTIVSNAQFCAGALGKGTSQGDSGGPLHVVHKGETIQIGLTSFGPAYVPDMYRQDVFPSVFTRVSSHCSFVSKATDNAAHCVS